MSLSSLRISRALARSDKKTFAKLWPKVQKNNMWVTSLWQKIFKEEKICPDILHLMKNSLNIDGYLLEKAKLERFVFLKEIFPFVSFSYPQTSSRLAYRITKPLLLYADHDFFGKRVYPPPQIPQNLKFNIYDCLSSLLQHHSIPSSLLSQNTNEFYEEEVELLNIAKILTCADNDLLDILLPHLSLSPQQKSFVLRRQIYLSGQNWNTLMEETTLEELRKCQHQPPNGFATIVVGLSSELKKAQEEGEALKLKQALVSELATEKKLKNKAHHPRKM